MESKVYTMEEWQRDGIFSAKIGQSVSRAVYLELRDCVPPAYNGRELFQVGEPYTHDKENGKPLYATFQTDEKGEWIYIGHCLLGQTEHRKGLGD